MKYLALSAAVCVITILIVIWSLYFRDFMVLLDIRETNVSLGDWGDSFGALSVLFSGFGTIFVVATLYLQADVQKRQREQITNQYNREAKLDFERTFFELFSMLRMQRDLLYYERPSSSFLSGKKTDTKGKSSTQPTIRKRRTYQARYLAQRNSPFDTLGQLGPPSHKPDSLTLINPGSNDPTAIEEREIDREIRAELGEKYQKSAASTDAIKLAYTMLNTAIKYKTRSTDAPIEESKIESLYKTLIHRKHESEFGPYHRTIYFILRRIDQDNFLSEDEKVDYSKLLRSQLTGEEVALLGASGLCDFSDDLKKYLTKYRMLRYIQKGSLHTSLQLYYEPEAFESR